MRDRTPTKVLDNGALRYGVYDASGNFLRYEYLVLDDDPTDSGTILSKATLLKDATEADIFGGSDDRTVDDALMGISQKLNANISDVADLQRQVSLIMGDVASITLTLKDSAGKAIPGVLVTGVLTESGQPAYSNDSGVISGVISEGTQTISITGYADIADYSETLSVTKGSSITKVIVLDTRNFLKITENKNVKFSGNVETVDVTVVGGGGAGGSGCFNPLYGGSGGGGGYCVVQTGVAFVAGTLYPAVIGAGGKPVNNAAGSDGESSSFLGITAAGGKGGGYANLTGGAGNGAGGNGGYCENNRIDFANGANGSAGSVNGYSSYTGTTKYGGGGGGGASARSYYTYGVTIPSGGADYGAKGGCGNEGESKTGLSAAAGTGGGGGGGYAYYETIDDDDSYDRYYGGSGGSGCIAVRMHLKSA